MPQPFVLWQGKGKDNHIYRLVDRGPVRAGKNDRRFVFERGAGCDGMWVKRWLPLKPEMYPAALESVIDVLGGLLSTRVNKLMVYSEGIFHLVGCETNMAIVESRASRGCDCVGAPGRYGRPDPTGDEQEPDGQPAA